MTTRYMHFQGPTFTMLTPTDWFITASPEVQAAFVAPEKEAPKSSLTVVMRGVEEDVTVPKLAAAAREKQEKEYPQYTIVSEKDWSGDGYEAFERRYTWHNDELDVTVAQRQLFMLISGIFYTITTTARASVSQEVDPIFVTMLNSFKIRDGKDG